MSETVIQISELSKSYRLGAIGRKTLSADLNRRWAHFRGKPDPLTKVTEIDAASKGSSNGSHHEEIWALKDISFEIKQGEVLGIIGRNGAGKSTLLKILSRVTAPTSGEVRVKGRIASLLEVGTGFHPELTGRENIFLNGAILGMTKDEIRKRFDEIVDFSEIPKYIDTPVKRYSSGMHVRLAFAVAAHLEPEILIVDEVLAVGDMQFQKKCLGKMSDVAKNGRTILFVSHNMDVVARLCPRSIFLSMGKVEEDDLTAQVIPRYISTADSTLSPNQWIDLVDMKRTSGTREAQFVSVMYNGPDTVESFHATSRGTLEVAMKIRSDRSRSIGSLAVAIQDLRGITLVNADTISRGELIELKEGENLVKVKINSLNLKAGTYFLTLWLADPLKGAFDCIEPVGKIDVIEVAQNALGRRPQSDGVVVCDFEVRSSFAKNPS